MFDRLKKLFGQAQSNDTVAQVTTQVQQGVDAVQATAQNVVDQAKDIKEKVMADGKIDMNDLNTVKQTAQEVATNVQEMVQKPTA